MLLEKGLSTQCSVIPQPTGADKTIKNQESQTAYQLSKDPEVAKLLQLRRATQQKTEYEGSDEDE